MHDSTLSLSFTRTPTHHPRSRSRQAHCYDVHGRFSNLVASDVPARLQLAALYAATSTLLPEPRSRMTGAQMAIELVRQVCWRGGARAGAWVFFPGGWRAVECVPRV